MSTSLSQQLKRLAVPQTAALIDARRKASILFEPKEAAAKDRRTIYELGLSGLQELIALNPNFQQFEATLFEEATLNLERSVEHSELNRLLDLNIEKFLHRLSPYFLLRPAHMCLEWLLRRFHIHEYNRNALLALALPYHETNTFVRVLQTVRLRQSGNEWVWLRPLQKPGLPLPKGTIINRAISDTSFLAFVCQSTQDAVRELGPYAHLLQTQLNFYACVLVGALNGISFVSEKYVVAILPSLLQGFSSNVLDYVSAVYIIASQLVSRIQLTNKLCNSLVKHVAAVSIEKLRPAAMLLLILIFDSQQACKPQFSTITILQLVRQKWLTELLASFAKDNIDIYPLCEQLLKESVSAIHNNATEAELFKLFLNRLLSDVEFPATTAQKIIDCFLDVFVAPTSPKDTTDQLVNDDDIIELDSDEESTESDKNFQSWYSDYLHKLERQYPNAFDQTIKDALKANVEKGNNRSKALKIAVGFRLKSFGQSATDIYESLYHHTASIRLCAIQTLLTKLNVYKARPQNYQLLQECLADRICDDSELVVKEVLKLPTKDFVDVLGYDKFMDALLRILHKTQIDSDRWEELMQPVLNHLVAEEIVNHCDNNLILLALMPLLFPNESSLQTRENITYILKSPLAKKFSFLRELQPTAAIKGMDFSSTEFKKQFLDVVSSAGGTPTIMELLNSVRSQGQDFFKSGIQFAHFLLLMTGCCKEQLSSAECLEIFKQVCVFAKPFRVRHLENVQWKKLKTKQFIPLQLYFDFVTTLTQHTEFVRLLQWEESEDAAADLSCFLHIFALLAEEAFTQEHPTDKLEWTKLLKDLFNIVFTTAQSKLEFLINFYVYEQLSLVSNYSVLRIRAFKLTNALLSKSENELTINTTCVLKMTAALNSHSGVVRVQALETLNIICSRLREHLRAFVEDILQRSSEISMDHEQYALVLYPILNPSKMKHNQIANNKILLEILTFLNGKDAINQAVVSAEILKSLKHINSEEILNQLIPLANSALDKYVKDDAVKLLPAPYNTVFQLIVERFDEQTIANVLLDNEKAWQLLERAFQNHDVFLRTEGKLQPLPCFILETLDAATYQQMPQRYRTDLIKLIINVLAVAENDTIFLAAKNLMKKCAIDCAPLVSVLDGMLPKAGVLKPTKRKSTEKREGNVAPCQIYTIGWKEGVALLEILEGKRRLSNIEKLIPVLFELLKYCLQVDERPPVEYTKQLTLSALLHGCQKAQTLGVDLPSVLLKSTFRIDQIVQCLRSTQNPQTHNHSLMLLSHCAKLFPQQVLHNIVDIFTFMGSSVVRHDDAFSFHIINSIIESIIPILVDGQQMSDNKKSSAECVNPLVVPVLKVFSDIMLDVPEHRRLPLYTKLLQTLGAERYLWTFLAVVFEAHVIADEKQRLLQKKKNSHPQVAAQNADKLPKRVEIVLELTNAFEPQIVLETCIQLMHYIKSLPLNKSEIEESQTASGSPVAADAAEVCLFDVKCRTAKHLRHFKYIIMQYLSTISNSPQFLRKIALFSDEQLLALKPFYQNFIIKTLSYVPVVSAAIENADEASQIKFWKVILHHVHDVLDNAISLLSPDMFLLVVSGLMQHQMPSIRKKVIELLISKLQLRDSYFEACDDKNFHNLLQPLTDIVNSILQKSDDIPSEIAAPHASTSHNELVFIQQNALIAIKLLSKVFALKYIEDFKVLLGNLTKIMKKRSNISKILLATIILAMVEISSNLKAHSLAYLPKYMPQLIEMLQEQADIIRQQPPDHVCIALITGMQKLVESLPLFLGPYIVDIISSLSSITSRIQAQRNEKDLRSATALNKISSIWTKMGNELPVRVLVPSCEKAYKQLVATKSYTDISVLMKLLFEAVSNANNSDLSSVQVELTTLFLEALALRQILKGNKLNQECLNNIEASVTDAFVAWVLKLSESSFRPLYYKVYEWALKSSGEKETILTYFLLTKKIAEALKSLFVLFASTFIEDAARLLNESNSTKVSSLIDPDNELLHSALLHAILSTLYNIFLHDSKKFVNTQRFEVLMQPIVDQLENRLVLEDEMLQQVLSKCIAQLAVAVSSDVLWKQLNYQVLLKTRTNVPEVRILSFNCCVEIARKLGDDFTPLLPETVPFIAELFEDENPRVEKNTRTSVQEMEGILGESLQKYF